MDQSRPPVWIYAPDGTGNSPRIATVEAVMRDGDLCAINYANAQLISSAPCLLAALKNIVAWKDAITLTAPELGGLLTAIYQADAAIAKAEGGA